MPSLTLCTCLSLTFIAFDFAVVMTSADVRCGAGSHFSSVQHCVPGYLTRLLSPLSCGSYFRPCGTAVFAMWHCFWTLGMLHQVNKNCMLRFATMSCVTTNGRSNCYTCCQSCFFASCLTQILAYAHWSLALLLFCWLNHVSMHASYVGVWASVHSCGKLCLDGPDNDCGGHLPDIC